MAQNKKKFDAIELHMLDNEKLIEQCSYRIKSAQRNLIRLSKEQEKEKAVKK